jgi:hypothetical protein
MELFVVSGGPLNRLFVRRAHFWLSFRLTLTATCANCGKRP